MKATSSWLESLITLVNKGSYKYNVIMAREFATCICGLDNRMPWYVVEDLVFFKKITMGSIVVMGRHTMESLNCIPLPGRVNVVLSTTLDAPPEGFVLIRDIKETLSFQGKVFFIGGPTLVANVIEDRVHFPEISLFLNELDIPEVANLHGRKIYLHDYAVFGKRKPTLEFSSDWLQSDFSNVKLKAQRFILK